MEKKTMKAMKYSALFAALLLGACSHTIQASSGADYVARYNQTAYQSSSTLDGEIRDIAAIEPNLRFPARFGLARIEKGQLTGIPADEAELWTEMTERQGSRYGEFLPISPLVTSMVSAPYDRRTTNIVNDIRKGAARQHVDYVLIYEVTDKKERRSNDLRVGDATILGLFLLPSRKVKIDSTASAILLDVRNGYPYVTATSFAENKGTTSAVGVSSKRKKLTQAGRIEAVGKLTLDVENALRDLKDEAYEQLVAEGY